MRSIMLMSPPRQRLLWVVLLLCLGVLVWRLSAWLVDSDTLIRPAQVGTQVSHAQQAAASPHPSAGGLGEAGWSHSGTPSSAAFLTTGSPLDTVKPPNFRADAKGKLIVDEQTRAGMEQVFALHQGPDVLRKLDEFASNLPPPAKQALRDLYQHYVQYDAALTQSLAASRDEDNMTLETADRELETLHDLRQTYFGAEQAKAMYEKEESASREMHDYMRNHTDPNLPLAQRAEWAQAAWLNAHPAPSNAVRPSK